MKYGIVLLLIVTASCAKKKDEISNRDPGLKEVEHLMETAYKNDHYEDAIFYLKLLIVKDSLNGEYYFKRGICYSGLLMRNESVADFQKAIALNYRIADSYYNLGTEYRKFNDSLALFYFRKALDLNPNSEDIKLIVKILEAVNSDTK
jgi:tetratricopeptide (TPR) repeat protein